MEFSLKDERKLWACNAWTIASSGSLYQYSDRYSCCLNVHQRKAGGWGIGVINLQPVRWGPLYDNQALAVWNSFEWLHRTFPVKCDDDLYIRYKLLTNLISGYKTKRYSDEPKRKFGILSNGIFTLTTDRPWAEFGSLTRGHERIVLLCESESPAYKEHQRATEAVNQRLNDRNGQWRPMKPKDIHDRADEVVDNPNDFSEVIGTPDLEIRPAHDVVEHIKTYTEESPLFGRLVGTFKWRKHPRREK